MLSLLLHSPQGLPFRGKVWLQGMQSCMTELEEGTHSGPNTSIKLRRNPRLYGHTAMRRFSYISIVVQLAATMRACMTTNPNRLSEKAIASTAATNATAGLQDTDELARRVQGKHACHTCMLTHCTVNRTPPSPPQTHAHKVHAHTHAKPAPKHTHRNTHSSSLKGGYSLPPSIRLVQNEADARGRQQDSCKPASETCVDKKEKERLVVEQAHTVDDPDAVVVHLQHAASCH